MALRQMTLGAMLFAVWFLSPVDLAIADGEPTPRPSGLYTNRHHHEMDRVDGTECEPDFERARELAEMATGKAVKGTYHTRSKDISPDYSTDYQGPLPGSVYIDGVGRGRHFAGRPGRGAGRFGPGYGVSVDLQDVMPRANSREFPDAHPHRDCLSSHK